jgi:hypothetical protein
MRQKFIPLACMMALAACSTTPSPASSTTSQSGITGSAATSWQHDVTLIQAGWPIAEEAVNAILTEAKATPATTAAVQKVEASITAEVAALSATQSPASIAAILGDVQTLVDGLPATSVSDTHKVELDAFISVVGLAL